MDLEALGQAGRPWRSAWAGVTLCRRGQVLPGRPCVRFPDEGNRGSGRPTASLRPRRVHLEVRAADVLLRGRFTGQACG